MGSKGRAGFVKELLSFYDQFLTSVADSLESLAEIQTEYKNVYLKLKEFQKDPQKLYELSEKKLITIEERRILIDFLLQLSKYEDKLLNMYEMKPDDQRKLAKELKKFVKDAQESFEEE